MGRENYQGFYGSGYKYLNLTDKDDMVRFHVNQKMIQTLSMFSYEGLPDTITQRDLELLIQSNGFAGIIDYKGSKKKGLYAVYGNLGGEPNAYYLPTKLVVANPYLELSNEYEIDKDCVIIKNDGLYLGLLPLNKYRASQLVDGDLSLKCLLTNARALALAVAPDNNAKKDLEEFFDALEKGDTKVVVSKNLAKNIESLPLATQNITNNIVAILEYVQYIKGSWWNDLGVQSNYNMKRETITSNENILNVDSLLPLSDNMLFCRREGVEKVNEMFGTSIKVDFSSSWKKIRDEIAISEEREKLNVQSTEPQKNEVSEKTEVKDENKDE
nr:MAG TPA: upper collar protein [Caudoviricetes sp.]